MYRELINKEVKEMTKSRRLGKILSFILAAWMVLSVGLVSANAAVAEEPEVSPCYVNISSKSASLKISGITANCTATLKAGSSMKLTIKMELQKLSSGSYSTVKTWTDTTTGKVLSMSESRLINALSDYRLKVTFTAGSETATAYKYA